MINNNISLFPGPVGPVGWEEDPVLELLFEF